MEELDKLQQMIMPVKGLTAELGKLDVVTSTVDAAISSTASSVSMLTSALSATMNAVSSVAISAAYLAQVVGMQMAEGYNGATVGISGTNTSMQTMNADMSNGMAQVQQMNAALQGVFATTNNNIIQVSMLAPLQQVVPAVTTAAEKTQLLTVENINAGLSVLAFAGYFDPLEAVIGNVGIELGWCMNQLVNFMGSVEETDSLLNDIQDGFTVSATAVLSFGSSVKDGFDGMIAAHKYYSDTTEALQKMGIITNEGSVLTNIYTKSKAALNLVMAASPIFIIIGAAIALGAALYVLWQRSESFRRILFGVWEVAKTVFKGLFDIGKFVFDAYITMWKGIGEVILGALKAPFDGGKMFKEGLGNIAKSTEMLTAIPDKMHKLGEDVGKAWAQGQDKGGESFRKAQEEKKKGKQPIADAGPVVSYTNIAGGTPAVAPAGNMATANSKTINVRIESLVKEVNVYNEMKNGAQEIRNLIKEELIAAVRDFELSVSNG